MSRIVWNLKIFDRERNTIPSEDGGNFLTRREAVIMGVHCGRFGAATGFSVACIVPPDYVHPDLSFEVSVFDEDGNLYECVPGFSDIRDAREMALEILTGEDLNPGDKYEIKAIGKNFDIAPLLSDRGDVFEKKWEVSFWERKGLTGKILEFLDSGEYDSLNKAVEAGHEAIKNGADSFTIMEVIK